MNFMPIITFSIFIIGKYKAATRRILVVCQFSYVSRETLLKYSNLYNGTDTGTLAKFRYELCASCRHRALCLSVSEFARMAANKRTERVGIWACSRSCTAIRMRVK